MTVLIDLAERQEVIAPDPPAPWRRVLLGAVALVGLAMAAITWLVGTPPQPGVLVTDSSGLVSGIDPETGATRLTVTNGLASPDGSTVYRIEDTPTGDRIEIVDSTTGQVAASTPVDQGLRLAVVGVAGQAAVLVPAGETEDLLYAPRPREGARIRRGPHSSGQVREHRELPMLLLTVGGRQDPVTRRSTRSGPGRVSASPHPNQTRHP